MEKFRRTKQIVNWKPGDERVPGFSPPRAKRTAFNRLRTDQGAAYYLLHKWGIIDSVKYECDDLKTIKHVYEVCPLMKFRNGVENFHRAKIDATDWIQNFQTRLWYLLPFIIICFYYCCYLCRMFDYYYFFFFAILCYFITLNLWLSDSPSGVKQYTRTYIYLEYKISIFQTEKYDTYHKKLFTFSIFKKIFDNF